MSDRFVRLIENLRSDALFGFRLLRRSPGFSSIAILTIALGVGASAAVFGLVDAVLLRSLPYQPFDRLVLLWHQSPTTGQDRITLSTSEYQEYAALTRSFTAVGAARGLSLTARVDGEPVAVGGVQVTPNLFRTLGISPALGRGFGEWDENTAGGRVAMVTHEFWQRTLAGNRAAIGTDLVLRTGFGPGADPAIDGSYTIVGVLPPDARIPYRAADVWIPLRLATAPPDAGDGGLIVFGQLGAGVSLEQASVDLATATQRLAERFPDRMLGRSSWLITLRAEDVGDITPTLMLVAASVALIALIVCVNLGNMLLSRIAERQREMALRRALGAGDQRIVTQLLTEAGLLGAAGAVAGVVLAFWLTRLLAATGPATVSRIVNVELDGRGLLVAIVAAVAMTLVFGLVPAIRMRRDAEGALALREARATAGGRLRDWLIGVEVAVAFVVLVGAGLVIKSAISLGGAPIGYDPRGILTFHVALPRDAYAAGPARALFTTNLLERLRGLPGVQAAGGVSVLPQVDANPSIPFTTEGTPDAGDPPSARFRTATQGYFASIGIPLLDGRDFSPGDESRRAVVVSRSFSERYAPSSGALGRRIRLRVPGLDTMWIPIVGVVDDVRQWVEATAEPTIYLLSAAQPVFSVAVRTAGDPAALAPLVPRVVREVDPHQPIANLVTMEQRLARGQGLSFARFRTVLMSGFGCVALLLAALGIYVVVRYAVVRRTREFGIRMALGATRQAIVRAVLARSVGSVLPGVAVGLVLSLVESRLVASHLYGMTTLEPVIIASVAALLALLAIAAAVEPAARAGAVDPLEALRS